MKIVIVAVVLLALSLVASWLYDWLMAYRAKDKAIRDMRDEDGF